MLPVAFRLGSTSYVYDAGLAENAERLAAAGLVQDIELVLFDVEGGPSNVPDSATAARLARVRETYGISYTVHLPLDLRSTGEGLHPSLAQAQRVIALTQPLSPWAYVAHLDGEGRHLSGWDVQAAAALDQVVTWAGPVPLAVENLESYDAERFTPLLAAAGAGRCIDIGHLWKQGRDPLPVLEATLSQARVVHWHGCVDGRDHLSLAQMPPEVLDPIMQRLVAFEGVLSLEVFGEDDFFSSRAALLAALERVTHGP